MQGLFEIMVQQIKQKRGIGFENPSPRSFSGGLGSELRVSHIFCFAPRLSKTGTDGKKRRPFWVLEIEEDVLNPKSRVGKGESVRILESQKTYGFSRL